MAGGWTAAEVVYRPLAVALVAACPVRLAGRRVLDVGSGPGAVASAAAAAGATVVAVDRSAPMLEARPDRTWPAAVADVLALPAGPRTFDIVLAAFLLNHLDPLAALAEMARVVRPGGAVVASTWAARPDPVKSAIDRVLADRGWEPPDWYRQMKSVIEEVSGDPERLGAATQQAGLVDVATTIHAEHLAVRDPLAAVGYRLATPHIAPWVSALGVAERNRLVQESATAVEPLLEEWRPAAIFLTARVERKVGRRVGAPADRPS
ncbi:MAG TPA: class I SAM-dependent methyltransferase [Acidimicrobiales bacterium]|nr:class I SAM-dependent methyltransferase [Acidimicrobiales bacterium]